MKHLLKNIKESCNREEKQEEDVIIQENDKETDDDLIASREIDSTLGPLEKPSEEIFNATGSTSGFSSAPVPEDSFYDETKNIDENLIGIKATTNEKLGPEGREEGISCHSVVLLEKK